MKLLVCLAFLALASCASANFAQVTLTLWTDDNIGKSYTQSLLVPVGLTLEGLMNITAIEGNTFFGWSYISSDPNSAYLNIGGIVDSNTG